MRAAALKAYEVYIITAFALATWALANPHDDYCFTASGASLALTVVGVYEAIARRFRRPDPQPCKPPDCYCGTCLNCQAILGLTDVSKRTRAVDFDSSQP